MTLGHENAGWIEAFGPGTLPTPGLEVGSPDCRLWRMGLRSVQQLS